MCGIAGVIGAPEYKTTDVAGMVNSMIYRGPDAQDVIAAGPSVLGFARLAVVGLRTGGQPMSDEDGTVWVVFNGEIYNYVELRDDLKQRGYRFRTNSDTEVLIHLWREKGAAMLADLVGMFAFCIWDSRLNSGILARDRQGVKPCYIMDLPGGGLAFGSEIKAILSLRGVAPDIDDIGLNLVHSYNYCPPPRTCYRGISHLEPGTYLEIAADGSHRARRYWTWPFAAESEEMTEEVFGDLLDRSVGLHMRFGVKGCLFLSGGVDSSVLSAHLQDHWNEDRILAFGLDCREDGYGEFHLARQVADKAGMIDLHPVSYDHSIVPANVADVLFHTDQPQGDFSFFLIRSLSQAARAAGVVVAINGDGPDEALCGYVHNYPFAMADPACEFPVDAYFSAISFMPEASRRQVLTDDFRAALPDPAELLRDKLRPWRDLPPIQQIAAWECTALNPGNNLVKSDRMTSAHSIESRPPYFDHRISEALVRLPSDSKLREGIGKYFLKSYGLRFFDKNLMFRRKSMPTMPIGDWIKGPLEDWARETLRVLDPARYSRAGALTMFEDHKAGKANYTRELRTLLMSASWSMAR